MPTVYTSPRRTRFRHARPTPWQRLIAQFRYVIEVGW